VTRLALALTGLALLLVACVPPDPDGDETPVAPAVERSGPRHPAPPSKPARQKPRTRPKPPKESLQAGEYYRWVDESGRVRMASSLDEVPERQRSTAGRVTAPKPSQDEVTSGRGEAPDPTSNARVVLYTTQSCPWCVKATRYLDSIGQEYVSWDIERDPEKLDELLRLTNGRSGVPVVVVGNRWMQGWNQEQLDRMLREDSAE